VSRLSNLKDNPTFLGLSITDDYTQYQRKIIKEWVTKANQRNQQESENSVGEVNSKKWDVSQKYSKEETATTTNSGLLIPENTPISNNEKNK